MSKFKYKIIEIDYSKNNLKIDSSGLYSINSNYDKFDFKLIFFNPDGSKSFCGNGSICSVHYLKSKNLIPENCQTP